ncbi:aminotransferase class I/II-fold pyridoxal phosphate-dependent enzyme [Rhizobium sp. 1AS11]|uniref:pyridoxal phosphate-dependent aminotransferase n=1 Tax=Rhizobium acaciae TaxID=2989736 RepID=UPI0022224E2F|nr:aminotransferase class I/II-fold pyridoxal phosphate-dependent enzyme [Rhizobium acaciae]MCW1413002.1 aminotransferase class I/II-fold pyridoxal phosphate-dependent enzyme [Rhizobium acaciae]MCW1745154.1 aminotransferase class I/II-fold pyridoxal phosphate-dependent enzyme [Rhizobium acaciae]
MLAKRMSSLSGSGTAAAREAVAIAAGTGRQIVDLAAGEVIIGLPPTVRDGAIAAIDAGLNRYTDSIGIPPLRTAVAEKLSASTRVKWGAENIAITNGAKQALLNAALAVLDPGDEAIIFRPCWPTIPSQVLLAGAKPVFIDVKPPSYVPTIDGIRAAVTPHTKAIILNSPNNPTGAVYDRATLQAIGDLAITYQLWIVSDECYSSFVFSDHGHQSIVTAHPGVRAQTILVNAFSKELALMGWRVGYFAAPPAIVSAAKKLQSHMTSNVNVIAQHAILHHLKFSDGSFEREMINRLASARRDGLAVLSRLVDVRRPAADGSFFFYLDLSELIAKLPISSPVQGVDDIARILLDEAGVASVAGSTFGDPAGLRLSFGAPPELLIPALEALVETLNALNDRQRPVDAFSRSGA